MDAINNVAEAPLVRTDTLSTAPTKDDLIDVLAVDFAFLLCLFEKLFGTAFGTLFLATLQQLYLFAGWRFVIGTFSICFPNLLVEDGQLDNDLFLALQHPALDAFFDLFPTTFILNLNGKAVGSNCRYENSPNRTKSESSTIAVVPSMHDFCSTKISFDTSFTHAGTGGGLSHSLSSSTVRTVMTLCRMGLFTFLTHLAIERVVESVSEHVEGLDLRFVWCPDFRTVKL